MTVEAIENWLTETLADRRFSRAERQALGGFLSSLGPEIDRETIRRQAFSIAAKSLDAPESQAVIGWLEEVFKALREEKPGSARPSLAEAYFSPGDEPYLAITRYLDRAQTTVDICVFTITDDRLAEAVLHAHKRGVALRIITDNSKAEDLGSDVERFERAMIPLRVDRSPFHMHHKFAIIDRKTLLNGSYNWTRGAANDNEENLVAIDDPRLVAPFLKTFDRLWSKLG